VASPSQCEQLFSKGGGMRSIDTVWIVGAGGVGSVLGGRLEQALPGSVIFVDSWPEHVRLVRSDGLTVTYPDGPVTVRPNALLFDELSDQHREPDLVVLAVKAYDTRGVVEAIEPFIGQAPILSLQNAINEDTIAEVVGIERTIGGVCLYSAALTEPGHAVQGSAGGKIIIGELDRTISSRISEIHEFLSASVPVEISENIWCELWTKLVRNAMVNGIAALANLGMGDLVLVPGADQVCIGLGSEAIRVAGAAGFPDIATADLFDSPRDFPVEWYLKPAGSVEREQLEQAFHDSWVPHRGVYPSMLQDMRKGRRTEIEALNGYVSAKGREARVSTPLNDAITSLVMTASATSSFGDVDSAIAALLPLVA
jgi:2-dehydropantoate 2-reductase